MANADINPPIVADAQKDNSFDSPSYKSQPSCERDYGRAASGMFSEEGVHGPEMVSRLGPRGAFGDAPAGDYDTRFAAPGKMQDSWNPTGTWSSGVIGLPIFSIAEARNSGKSPLSLCLRFALAMV